MKHFIIILLFFMVQYMSAMNNEQSHQQVALQHDTNERIPLLPKHQSPLHGLIIMPNNHVKINQTKKEIKQNIVYQNEKALARQECGIKKAAFCCCPVLAGAGTWLMGTYVCVSCGNAKALWGYVALTSIVCCLWVICDDD